VTPTLPADGHVHSEWSWDTGGPDSDAQGTMAGTCERAMRIGLPAVIFTEHLDLDDRWRAGREDFPVSNRRHIDGDGYLTPPLLDVEGYFEAVERCRRSFPDLRILSGLEFGQPHLFENRARQLVDLDRFDRINGSLHTLPIGPDRAEPVTLYHVWPPEDVLWTYLEEVPRMVVGSASFDVFSHLDYAVRHWPTTRAGPFDPGRSRRLQIGDARHRRQWPGAGDEHPKAVAVASPVVEGGRRPSRLVRQRRPRARSARGQLPGSDGHARLPRLRSRFATRGLLDALAHSHVAYSAQKPVEPLRSAARDPTGEGEVSSGALWRIIDVAPAVEWFGEDPGSDCAVVALLQAPGR